MSEKIKVKSEKSKLHTIRTGWKLRFFTFHFPLFTLFRTFVKIFTLDAITTYLPITNPTWIFFLVLCVILFAPMIFSKLRIPHLIGMILAGVLIGEHGFNLLARDASFELFGKVGIYFIMFLAGLEMDLQNLKQNRIKGFTFGFITTAIPFA